MPDTPRPDDGLDGLTIDQICNFVAVEKTGTAAETIQNLIVLCMTIVPEDKYRDTDSIRETVNLLFGLSLSDEQIEKAIDALEQAAILTKQYEIYVLSPHHRQQMDERVSAVRDLEKRIQAEWQEELSKVLPNLDSEIAWKTLRKYLEKAFLRHGIQAIALLNPLMDIPERYTISLSSLLNISLNEEAPASQRGMVKQAVTGFMATVAAHADRASYIAQLGDSAFNFYKLRARPEIADSLRKRLSPLTIFLDTNFLFGILGLHDNSQIDVSTRLVNSISQHEFPFKLRYHGKTIRELNRVINNVKPWLIRSRWTQAVSRAAVDTRSVGSIEFRYHQENARNAISAEDFFKPFEHVDVLLKDKDIQIYNTSDETRLEERAELHHRYADFLKKQNKEKLYEAIDHDVTLLDAVRQMRSKARSSLEAGALLITCDYNLYRFDWVDSRKAGVLPCVVMPDTFWQILRPYVPVGSDFEKSFAETFAIPEFRAIDSNSAKACSKMLGLLNAHKGISSDTVVRLLSNDMLLDSLKEAPNDTQFQEAVESALADDNKKLLEEKAKLESELASERSAKREADSELSKVQEKANKLAGDADLLRNELGQKNAKIAELQVQEKQETVPAVMDIDSDRIAERQAEAEKIAAEATSKASFYSTIAAASLAAFIISITEIAIHFCEWQWLLTHPKTNAIQSLWCVLVILLSFALLKPSWRKTLIWSSGGAMAVLIILLSQIDKH